MTKKRAFAFIFLLIFVGTILVGCARTKEPEGENGATGEGVEETDNANGTAVSGTETAEGKAETSEEENPYEKEEEPSAELQTDRALYVRSKTDGLNVRAGAGTNYRSLGTLDKGDMVAYIGESDGWYETKFVGVTAYVSASAKYTEKVAMEKRTEKVERAIEEGFGLLGTKYVYGAVRLHDGSGRLNAGFDITAFDCSSFMQYVFYYGADEILQVNTRTQVYQGESVEKAAIERGDLLFFTNASRYYNSGVERIGHVALYLGDGYILHTASDHAVAEKISEKRQSYFICARRIITD